MPGGDRGCGRRGSRQLRIGAGDGQGAVGKGCPGVPRGAEEGAGMGLAVQGVSWGAGKAFVGLGHPEQFWGARGIGTGCISRGRMAHTGGAWEGLCGMWRGCLRDLQECLDVHGVYTCRLWGALSGMPLWALPPCLTPGPGAPAWGVQTWGGGVGLINSSLLIVSSAKLVPIKNRCEMGTKRNLLHTETLLLLPKVD